MLSSCILLAPQAVEATPTVVTVYPDRAWVEREAHVELAAGAQEVVIGPLPDSIHPDSIQATATGPAAVTDVAYRIRREATPAAQRNTLAQALQAAEDALFKVMNRAAVLDADEAFLDGLRAKAVAHAGDTAGTAALDTVAAARQMEFIAKRLGEVLDARIGVRRAQESAQQAVDAARAKLNASGGSSVVYRELVVRLQVAKATASTITVSALESRAAWSPVYDARINATTGDVTLDYRGQVVQTTGEAWDNVQMTLSTAEPSSSLEPPSIGSWIVRESRPPPPASAGRPTRRTRGLAVENEYAGLEMEAMADSDAVGSGASFKQAAIVGGSPVNVTYTLPGRVDVPSDGGADRRLHIGDTSLEGELVHLAVPSKTDEVFLMAEATNPGPYLLLPGPASLFVDGGFVGRTGMPTTAPGEPVRLPFGPLPSITTKRSVKTNRATKGLFGDSSQFLQDITVVIENSSNQAVTVRVMDHRPVSQNEKIKVTIDNLSAALSSDPQYVRDEKPRGILRWDIEVPANAVGKDAMSLTWTLDVRWPKSMAITGI
jgi:uncharacterized protein (TIGR02231 family)